MDIQNEIIQTIDLMIEKRIDARNLSRIVQSVVVSPGEKGYIVTVDGFQHNVPCVVGLSLMPGVPVWVFIPNGNISKAFIIGTVRDARGNDLVSVTDALNYYDPDSDKPISGIGVKGALATLVETENIDFSKW